MYAREAAIALQRLTAEEARRKSDEIFYNIAQNSPLPIALIEPDGTYRYINDSFTRLFGYDLNDFHTGREWFHLAFPVPVYRKQAVEVWKVDRAQYPKGYPFARTFTVRCKDSSDKVIIFRPVTLSDGKLCIVYEDITERNKAEQTHRLLSSIIESTSDAVIAKDKEGMVLSWNKAAELLYGYTAQEMFGKHISLIVPEDKTEEMVQIFSSIERGESISNLETRRIRKDSRVIDISMTISPITDDTGTVVGASTIARDITPRKAEEHLRESEERYRALVENISVGIYRSTGDPTGRFIWGNSSLVHILGYPSIEKLMEVGISELFVERDGRKKLLDDLKKEGFVKNREIALRRGDEKTVWVLVTALAKFDKTGNLSCINGVVEDISGQKEAEQRVQIVDKQMQDILACIPDPVVIVDRENAVIAWNSAMEQLTGVQKTGVIGRNDYDQLFPFHNPTRPPLSTFFDAPDDELERHYPGAYRDGTVIIAQVRDLTKQDAPSVIFTIRASPLCDPQGQRTGAVLIIQSVMPGGGQRTSSPPFDSVSSGMR
jgi:PAS domain S-box-containing protein